MYTRVEQNLRAAMRCYGSIGGRSETRDYAGVTVASSGLDVPVFNSAMLTEPVNHMEQKIEIADLHFAARKLGWTFWICDDLVPADYREARMRQLFRDKGMLRIADPPGMYAEQVLPRTKPPADMTFARVQNEQTRLEFAHIASVVFSLAFRTSKRIYGAPSLWQPPSYGWIGYAAGKPVSVVTVVIASGVIGVYSLGTLPQHQGCGYGETLLRHALCHAQQESGFKSSVLQTTAQGMNLYLRMGYRIVTKFSIYMREGCTPF